MSKEIYQQITDQLIEKLEDGTVPWHKPWTAGPGGWPRNLKTGRRYNGINVWILSLSPKATTPYWLTFNQAKSLGGHVRKGEKSTVVVFWKFIDKEYEEAGETKHDRFPYLKTYRVFNASQCDGLKREVAPGEVAPGDAEELDFCPIEACEAIADGYKGKPEVTHDGNGSAFYRAIDDSIHLPERETFDGEAEYYSTLFHEFAHSTGSKGRLNREGVRSGASYDIAVYSDEELVAEFTAAMLCGEAGIERKTIENSAAYIKGWLKRLKDDTKLAVIAAARAQKAADHILGTK